MDVNFPQDYGRNLNLSSQVAILGAVMECYCRKRCSLSTQLLCFLGTPELEPYALRSVIEALQPQQIYFWRIATKARGEQKRFFMTYSRIQMVLRDLFQQCQR